MYVVQKHPEFFRDVCPNFLNSVVIIMFHLMYRYTENPCFILWLLFGLITVSSLIGPVDNQNIS